MGTLDWRRTRQPWYCSWASMKDRCRNKNRSFYKSYGGRGIKVDMSFWEMGFLWHRDKAGKMKDPTIDRIDNDGNYTYANCRFIERKDNIIKGLTGRPVSEETRRKIAEGNRGKIISAETRKKLSDYNKGKVLSEEHRKKMSISGKRRWRLIRGHA